MKKFVSILVFIAIFLSVLPFKQAFAADTKVYLKPAEEKIFAESDFVLELHIDDVTGLYAMGLDLVYDIEAVKFVSAEQGPFLTKDQTTTLMPIKNREEEGRLIFGISRTKDAPGVDGSGVIAKFTFHAIKTTETDIAIESLILKDSALMDLKAKAENLNIKILDKDTTPPEITVEKVDPTYLETATIKGKTEATAKLTINAKDVSVTADGTFSYDVTLVEGENKFEILATDNAGNVGKASLTIVRLKPIVIQLTIGKTIVIVNGEAKTIDAAPFIDKASGRTLIPIRIIMESINGKIDYDAKTRKVTLTKDAIVIELWIDKPIAQINGIPTPIDMAAPKLAPKIVNGRTFLPLRFVAENIGADVGFDAKTQTITVTYPKKQS
jgi:hypothetical protein